jgi:hypothetical protein
MQMQALLVLLNAYDGEGLEHGEHTYSAITYERRAAISATTRSTNNRTLIIGLKFRSPFALLLYNVT